MQLIPMGSQENAYFRMVVSYWDMAASFVTSGVLNQDLFFQSSGELGFVWERVRQLIGPFRDFTKNPDSWKHLETVGNAFLQYLQGKGPETYAGFQAMVRGANAAAAKK